MKKQSKKKAAKQPKKSIPFFPIIISLPLLINVILCAVIFFLFLLIQFTKLTPTPFDELNPVVFSYFTKRPDLVSSSKALTIYDAKNSITLLSKNQNLRFSPASTTKIMTALVALDHYDPSQVLLVNTLSERGDSSKMGLYIGEKMSALNLLYGMLLPSGGDAAEVLAENYPGGVQEFVSQMNAKARTLGLSNTFFVDPSGYSDNNYTTAHDLAQLGAFALHNSLFAQIVGTKNMVVTNVNGTTVYNLKNLNELLNIVGVNGIKTGFTNEAEGVLVTSYLRNAQEYIIVVLGSKDRFLDTLELIRGITQDLKNESFTPQPH